MGKPAAKQGDRIKAVDTHTEMVPSGSGEQPQHVSGHNFDGVINSVLISSVLIMDKPAAVKGSKSVGSMFHQPKVGSRFLLPPNNEGEIMAGSGTVMIGGKPAARDGDLAQTCDDVVPTSHGKVEAQGTVFIGG